MSGLYTIDEIKSKLLPVFQSAPVYRATLFGSYAKGLATESSDVDIVIDSQGKLLNLHFYGILEDITEALGKPVDLIEISEIKPESPILADIHQSGVVLYEQ